VVWVIGDVRAARGYKLVVAYLLTFCPPGPDDLLNETSPILRGSFVTSNTESHCLAVRSSSSVATTSSTCVEACLKIDVGGQKEVLKCSNILL